MPPKCHCDLDLETPNSLDVKLDYPWAMSSQLIDRTRFVYGPTDRYLQSNIPPLLHNNKKVEG